MIKMEQKIFIPKTAKYTYPIVVLFEPPVNSSFIQLVDSAGNTFQDGKLEGRRAGEISVFVYRPIKILEKDGSPVPQKHLIIGEKIICKVQVIDAAGKKISKEGEVTVE